MAGGKRTSRRVGNWEPSDRSLIFRPARIAAWLFDRNWIGCRKGILESFVQRLFLPSAFVAVTIVLNGFAFRIGCHFCFPRPPVLAEASSTQTNNESGQADCHRSMSA